MAFGSPGSSCLGTCSLKIPLAQRPVVGKGTSLPLSTHKLCQASLKHSSVAFASKGLGTSAQCRVLDSVVVLLGHIAVPYEWSQMSPPTSASCNAMET